MILAKNKQRVSGYGLLLALSFCGFACQSAAPQEKEDASFAIPEDIRNASETQEDLDDFSLEEDNFLLEEDPTGESFLAEDEGSLLDETENEPMFAGKSGSELNAEFTDDSEFADNTAFANGQNVALENEISADFPGTGAELNSSINNDTQANFATGDMAGGDDMVINQMAMPSGDMVGQENIPAFNNMVDSGAQSMPMDSDPMGNPPVNNNPMAGQPMTGSGSMAGGIAEQPPTAMGNQAAMPVADPAQPQASSIGENRVAATPENAAADSELSAPRYDILPTLHTLSWVGYGYDKKKKSLRIEMITRGSPEFQVFQETNQANQTELVFRFLQTDLRRKVRRDIDASEFRSPVAYIRMRKDKANGTVDVVLTMRDPVKPMMFAKEGNVELTFQIPERYFGNQQLAGTRPVDQAQALNRPDLVLDIREGSDRPQVSSLPIDPARGAFGQSQNSQVPIDEVIEPPPGQQFDDQGLPPSFDATWMTPESLRRPWWDGLSPDVIIVESSLGAVAQDDLNNFSFGNDAPLEFDEPAAPPGNAAMNAEAMETAEGEPGGGNEFSDQFNDEDLDTGGMFGDSEMTGPMNGSDEDNLPPLENNAFQNEFGGAGAADPMESAADTMNAGGPDIPAGTPMFGDDPQMGDEPAMEGMMGAPAADQQGPAVESFDSAEPGASQMFLDDPTLSDAPTAENMAPMGEGGFSDLAASQDLEGQSGQQGAQPQYNGKLIYMEFTEAPLSIVFKSFSEETGNNFVFPKEVGDLPITIHFQGVPWDEALKAILETHSLGMVRVGRNIVRVDAIEKLTQYMEKLEKAKEFETRRIPTKILVMRLNNAKAADILEKITPMLERAKEVDPRIRVSADERTNSVVMEAPEYILSKTKNIIQRLDLETPQVEIASRIVEVQKTNSELFGVSWLNQSLANFDPGRGLGFGSLNFPNNFVSNFAVDPGVRQTPATGNAQFRFGSINKFIDLDLVLRMEERRGTTNILQSNRVLVLDGQEASIIAGNSKFFRPAAGGTVVNQGEGNGGDDPGLAEVKFNLSLEVKPQVTADGAVIMDLQIKSDTPGDPAGEALADKNTRELTTQMIRESGDTGVIGGIYDTSRTQSVTGIPFLSDLPIIGALFRSTITEENQTELLIMVTPTIVSGRQSEAEPTMGEDAGGFMGGAAGIGAGAAQLARSLGDRRALAPRPGPEGRAEQPQATMTNSRLREGEAVERNNAR